MPRNTEKPRVRQFGLEDADGIIADVNRLLVKAKGVRKSIEKVPNKAVQVDGGKMAEDSLELMNKFLSKVKGAIAAQGD